MNINIITKGITQLGGIAIKNAPTILTTLGAIGVVGTTVSAVKATVVAVEMIEEAEHEKSGIPLTKIETVEAAWKPYIPTVILGTASIACIIGSHKISLKRQAVLLSAYQIATTKAEEYQEKVVEMFGEKKEQKVRDEIHKDHLEANPVSNQQVIFTGTGEHLCYDEHSGRYFKSDIEKIRRAVNNLNMNLIQDMFVPINEFYQDIGLKGIALGDQLGWSAEDAPVHVEYSSQLTDNNQPCMVIDFNIRPRQEFYA